MKVLLVAVDAKFIHKSIAVWYLKSYCNAFGLSDISIFEATINENREKLLQNILAQKADVIGFSCYIWNINLIEWLSEKIKQACANIKIIFGGPEMDDCVNEDNYKFCDVIIIGYGEKAMLSVLSSFKQGSSVSKIIFGQQVKLSEIPSPYTKDFFNSVSTNKNELSIKLIYYESSRGCPFSCAYCLSGKSQIVDYLEVQQVKRDLIEFLAHGYKTIKFIDRTFNADKKRAYEILQFVGLLDTDATFHFEVSADLFDDNTIQLINLLPTKRVQFEIGVQSTNKKVLTAVNRLADTSKILARSQQIINCQNCQVHLDLIAGLPYEDIQSVIKSFNDCIAIKPHKLQLGFLKLLKGSKIRQQSKLHNYDFQLLPPYEVISNNYISQIELQQLKSAEDVLNKFYNKPMFYHSISYMLDNTYADNNYNFFKDFSLFLDSQNVSSMHLKQSYTCLFEFIKPMVGDILAAHLIKLDSLSYDPKNVLPDAIPAHRNTHLQQQFLAANSNYKRVRVEYFEYLNKHIVFLYDKKVGVSCTYPYKII